MKKFLLTALCCAATLSLSAQAKKPTLMVIPLSLIHIFLGRIERRRLQTLPRQAVERFEHPLAGDVPGRIGFVDRVFEVVARGSGPQHQVGHVLFLLGLERIDHFGRLADADEQHARGQRVERPGMPDLDAAVAQPVQGELDLAHHVGRGPAQGFVDRGDVARFKVCLLYTSRCV